MTNAEALPHPAGTPATDPDPRGRAPRRRLGRLVPRAVGLAVALVLLVALVVAVAWPLTPAVSDAESRVRDVLAAHGAQDPHALPRPDRVGQAVVATEDARFFAHLGLDPLGALRAAIGFAQGASDPGGATLEQQLAKNLYTPTRDGMTAKAEQAELALKLDHAYPKAQILEMYLSVVYFGHGFYGLPAAARGYFGLAPADLSWAQASLLAGLVQAPSAYDPYAHRELARQRQRHVLDRLVATGVLSAAQADAAYRDGWHLRS
ncbi:MAG: transglycosylase domain-containing protein [Motilibacteraceae bacterium]